MFFYVKKEFTSFGKVNWDKKKTIVDQINEFIEQMGDSFDAQMTIYFEESKNSMKKRVRIPISLVDQHENDIYFLVDIDFTYIQVVIPRVRWLKPLGYELNVDQASTTITTMLIEDIEKTIKHFGTHDFFKSRVVIDRKAASATKRKDKLVKKLKKKFGVDLGEARIVEEVNEISDDDGNEDNGEDEPEQGPLQLT